MDYIVLSTSVVDDLYLADGRHELNVIGGAGTYALAGMKVWSDSVCLVTGVGEDYFGLFGNWYRDNSITMEGLIPKDANTPRNIVRYFEDGERIETPEYGLEHYRKIEGTPSDLERFCAGAKGVYVFKNYDKLFWERILSLKERYGFKLMWEIASDAITQGNLLGIREVAAETNVFSINRTEALKMLGETDIDSAVRKLSDWRVPMVYLRAGAEGAYAISGGKTVLVPSVPCEVIDVTGGGNSSSGGAFVGYCETNDAVAAAIMGNISASLCIAQHGVPEKIDNTLKSRAHKFFGEMKERLN